MDDVKVTRGSGNVFKDLDLEHDPETMFKIRLLRAITATIKKRNLTQVQAAKIMEIDQPKVSYLLRGHHEGYSVMRLIEFLTLLGKDINVHISQRHKHDEPGELRVCGVG